MMLGGYEAQPDYYPQWHQPYNYVTQLPYGKFYSIDIHFFYLLVAFINMLVYGLLSGNHKENRIRIL